MRGLSLRLPASIYDPKTSDRASIVVGIANPPSEAGISDLSIEQYLFDIALLSFDGRDE